jgi:16S rRNA (uracil1498-N3)-methyltransferase
MTSDPHSAPQGPRPKVRLLVEHRLGPGQQLSLPAAQVHYLVSVRRLAPGAMVALFDGVSGEWAAELVPEGRRGLGAVCRWPSAPQRHPPDLWLLFAPLKKARTDFLVEKAVELGAARLVPVATDFTQAERINPARMRAQMIEAAEQCGATHLPALDPMRPLAAVLAGWPAGRALLWADESRAGAGPAPLPPAPAAVLVGPEGGFSSAERARLAALPFVHPLALGPRVLRAETAAAAALVLWQAAAGDWR